MPFWRLIKDENHEISCVQFSFKFLDNIEIFMILEVILRASLTKIIKKSLDVCKKSLRQHRPRFAPLDALRQRCIFIDFPCVFQWFQWKFDPRWDFIDKFEICGLRQAGPASTRANIVKLYDFNFAYFSLCFLMILVYMRARNISFYWFYIGFNNVWWTLNFELLGGASDVLCQRSTFIHFP